MKIKTKLYLGVAVPTGLTIMLVLLSFQFSAEISNELKKADLADELVKATTEFSLITEQYLIYHHARMEQQWRSKFNSTTELIRKGESSIFLDRIRTDLESLNNSFVQLKAHYEEREELIRENASQEKVDRAIAFEERLAARMRLDSTRILLTAFEMAAESRQKANAIQKRSSSLVSGFAILLVLMIGTSTLFITKSIGGPIKELVKGANIIGRGNLAHRINIKTRDEIGYLSLAFNEMVEQLNQSREHLEELVKERTSELEEKTVELEEANIRLQQADRLKSIFLASMSHELRTPLNSIIGFAGIILQGMAGEINEEQRKQLTMVKNSANHLLSLINDLLDISKIEAGKVELLIEEFDLSALVQEVKDSFRVGAEEKGLSMSLQMPKRLTIKSDERRTKQVLVNLVGNAVKFTDRGEIETKVVKKDRTVEVSVNDTGIGIRKEEIDKLFKAFSQISSEGRPKQEGTGLGLYLSKKILGLLGGEIKADSEFGKGSVFTFTLPLKYEGTKR